MKKVGTCMKNVMTEYFDEIVNSTAELLRFDSSLKEADGEYPFGKEAADCLAFFLNLAEGMGFETRNYDNYVGEVIFGEGKDFAILAHLDVVPAGSGWKYPPFAAVINDEPSDGGVLGTKIWGRGAMDDKTPAVVCLYALKALKDQGITPNRTIKLIVGCNEEAGWKCIEHYNKVAVMPEEGFTPDADFPVIYAEKGIVHFTCAFPINEAPMSALKAGERVNMVCDFATAILTRKAAENLVGYENPIANTYLSYDNTTNILSNSFDSIFTFLFNKFHTLRHSIIILFNYIIIYNHVLNNIFCKGRAGLTAQIGTWRRHKTARLFYKSKGHLVGRHSNRHRIKASRGFLRHTIRLGQNHGQRPGPKGFSQLLCALRHFFYNGIQIFHSTYVYD